MESSKVRENLQALANECSTEEEVLQLVAALPEKEKMAYVYGVAVDEMFENIKLESLKFIDYCEDTDAVNDYEQMRGKQEALVGVILVASKMLQEQSENQSRHEMQCVSSETEYGMRLADSISDYAVAIHKAADDLSTLSSHYAAVLRGRQMGWHFISKDGDGVAVDDSDTQQLRLDLEEK